MKVAALERLVRPERELIEVEPGLYSALRPEQRPALYDARAGAYDRLIGSSLYTRLAWRNHPRDYEAFAAEALASREEGFLLDAGCGSLVSTWRAYATASRPVVLLDRSLEMLRRGRRRLGERASEAAPIFFVQADLCDLPFFPGAFTTVACYGVLHVFDDPLPALQSLRDAADVEGSLYLSMLRVDPARRLASRYMRALHRAGELGRPRTRAQWASLLGDLVGSAPLPQQSRGGMAFFVLDPAGTAPARATARH